MKLHKILYATVISLAAGMGITSCDVNYDYPPVISPDLGGSGSWDAPLSVAGAYAYYTAYYSDAPDTDKYYWVTGYIVGCVNTTETVFVCNDQTAAFSAPFESTSNLLLAQSPDCTDYTECISVQLPSGTVRNDLNLNANESNLGKQVSIRGYIDKYLSIPGVRSVTHYQWGPVGVDTGDVEVGKSEYILLTEALKSGRAYALVAEGTAAQTVSAGDNGFLYTEAVTIANNKFTASEKFGFMLTAIEEGSDKYYLTDYKGQFLYQGKYGTGWSNRPSIAVQPEKDNTGYYWTVVKNEAGGWVITNAASSRILAYDTSYKSYGLYESLTDQYLAPELYEMVNDPVVEPNFNPAEPGDPGEVNEGTGEGTLESPYDVVRALAIIEAGSMSSDNVYIKGKISEISEIDTSYGNATYYISNDGTTTKQLQVFRGKYLNGEKFTSTDAIKVGDELVILGQLIKYNTTPEVAQNSSIISINGEGGSTGGGEEPSTPSENDGSYENPFGPADVIALNPTSTTESPEGGSGVWVKGFIVGHMPSTNTLLENTVFGISEDVKTNIVLGPTADCTDYTQCISVQLPAGDVRNALNLMQNHDKLGAEVMLFGNVMKYCGAPGLKNTSKYEIVGEGGGSTGGGDTPSTGSTIYEGLISNCDDWTFDNVNLPEAATYIWSWKEYNGSYYLNASAYVSGAAYASEAYAYTTLDLTGKSDATLTFDHAAKFQTSLTELCAVVVRVSGTSSWTELSMPTWPEAGSWTFVSSGAISLKAYAGKKIEIGFKYGSSDGAADTWEIKNFIVTGN